MKKYLENTYIGISVKTSVLSGLIIIIMLVVNNFIGIRLQSDLSESIIFELEQNEKKVLAEASEKLQRSLVANMKINLDICTGIAQSELFNFDHKRLEKLLASYMQFQNIEAITILDPDDYIFLASWRADGVKISDELPEDLKLNEALSVFSEAVYEGNKVGSVRLYYTDRFVKQEIEERKQNTRKSIEGFKTIASKNIKKSVGIQVITGVVILFVLIATIILCMKMVVSRPIRQTLDMIIDIAQGEGDLTKRLNINSKDEIGDLTIWFNKFIQKLQEVIKQVSDTVRIIDTKSNEFNTLSDHMKTGIEGLSDRSNSVAAATEEMSGNMSTVAAAMDETASNVNMVACASEEMSSTINEIARSADKASSITNDAVSQTRDASLKVNELGGAANEIGKVVETITDISEQVNLLALNATIEAARAGEAGKGFAVVANEIKVLALETAKASGEIKTRVQKIQNSTEGTVGEISSITAVVTEINEIVSSIAAAVEEQSTTTAEIARNVSQASSGISDVNDNVAQGSQSSQQIAKEIAEITSVTSQMAESSADVKSNAGELLGLSEQLAALMAKFKV